MLFIERHYSMFDGTTNRDDYRTVKWNSLGPGFHFKIDFFKFIYRSTSLLETTYLSKHYSAEFENVFICWWSIFFLFSFSYHKRHSTIQNLFQKLNIFKTEQSSSEIWDCQWHKTFSVMSVSITLILLILFQIIKTCQCCQFTFTNFFFLLKATNTLATSNIFGN